MIHPPKFPRDLIPGDILLYGDSSPLSWLIRKRTWSDVSHVEIYTGLRESLAARRSGVAIYPFRAAGLRVVLRPIKPFNLSGGLEWFQKLKPDDRVYGWGDLWRFYGFDIPAKGLICSQTGDLFFQACGLPLFNVDYDDGSVAPRDYRTISSLLVKQVWSYLD